MRTTGGNRRGSAMALMIVVSVIITGMVMTLAWSSGVQAQSGGVQVHSDEAFYAADAGLQWALHNFKADPTWPATVLGNTGTTIKIGTDSTTSWSCLVTYADMGSTIGMSPGVLGNPLQFRVKATRSGTTATATAAATATGALADVPPQFWVGGDLTVAQSATVNGNVETQGQLTVVAPTGTDKPVKNGAKGVWKAAKKVTTPKNDNSGYFASAPVQNANDLDAPPMTANKLYTTLYSGPRTDINNVLTVNPATGHVMIDFTKAGGKPVYFAGNATYDQNVDIKPSSNPANDTIIINGPANFTGSFPGNQAFAQVNLVINGNVSFSASTGKGVAISGSFYVTGSWTQTGMYTFNGTVMVDKSASIGGTGSIGVAQPPTFDPRFKPKFTAYVGNLP